MEIVINTKNAGEEVLTFDCSKIAAAIAKAFESIQPVMEEAVQNISSALTAFAETMEEYTRPLMESIERASYRFIRHFLRILMQCIYSVRDWVIVVITYDPKSAIYYASIICVTVKSLTQVYLEHVSVSRRCHLLRRQDRGSTESVSDNDNYILAIS